jgi:hypothetical protein
MRRQTFTIWVLLAIGGAALVGSLGGGPATQPAAIPVPLGDVRDKGVMGELGVPLGTMVTVSGKAVPNNSRSKANEGEPLFLQITSVDGKALSKPVEYPFRKARDFIDAASPKIGDSFEFRGYETGGYSGVPLNYGAPWQDTSFYFSTEFLVLPKP